MHFFRWRWPIIISSMFHLLLNRKMLHSARPRKRDKQIVDPMALVSIVMYDFIQEITKLSSKMLLSLCYTYRWIYLILSVIFAFIWDAMKNKKLHSFCMHSLLLGEWWFVANQLLSCTAKNIQLSKLAVYAVDFVQILVWFCVQNDTHHRIIVFVWVSYGSINYLCI